MKNLLVLVIVVLACFGCTGSKVQQAADGKCYQDYWVTDGPGSKTEVFAIYTGSDLEKAVDIEVKDLLLRRKSGKWSTIIHEKCKSQNPKDCEMKVWDEISEIRREIPILIDTTQSKNFTLEEITYFKNSDDSYSDRVEIVCPKDITKSLIIRLQDKLREEGYYESENTGELDEETRISVSQYERENALPIANRNDQKISIRTLESLGIRLN